MRQPCEQALDVGQGRLRDVVADALVASGSRSSSSTPTLLEQNRDEIIDLLIAETGKPIDNAEYDFGMLTTCLRFFCEEAARIDQEVIPDPDGRFLHYTLRQPLGVVVGYLAWNFPLLNLGYKLGPVLAAGCTAIIKPSRLTPLATLAMCRVAGRSGHCRTAWST